MEQRIEQDQAAVELEQIGQRLRQAAPANLRANGDAELDELLDRINNEQEDELNGRLGIGLPRQGVIANPFPQHRGFRLHRPGQLLADADQIMEELEDFGQMMERIAGNRRAEEDLQPLAPLRPVPAPDRPVDLGAVFDHLRRQVANDEGDNEVRLRFPMRRPVAAAGAPAGNPLLPFPAGNDRFPRPVNPPVGINAVAPPGLAQVEPPRRVLRPRRNGAAVVGAPVINIEQANNVAEDDIQANAFSTAHSTSTRYKQDPSGPTKNQYR